LTYRERKWKRQSTKLLNTRPVPQDLTGSLYGI